MANQGHSAVHMIRCLNPLTHSVHYVPHSQQVAPLQHLCHATIRRTVTIKRFNQLPSLGLPARMEQSLGGLCLNNFLIDPAEVRAEHHHNRTFPATCLIDGSRVLIHLAQNDESPPADPLFITSFICNDITCWVIEASQTLKDYIESARESSTPISEDKIWKLIKSIASAISPLPANARVDPKYLHLKGEDVFYQGPCEEEQHTTQVLNTAETAFYEAPEIFMRQPPEGDTAKAWSLGCLAYELAALEPAFYDRDQSGNLMMVMMAITQGIPPPPITHPYSTDLLDRLIPGCMNKIPSQRMALADIIELADQEHSQ